MLDYKCTSLSFRVYLRFNFYWNYAFRGFPFSQWLYYRFDSTFKWLEKSRVTLDTRLLTCKIIRWSWLSIESVIEPNKCLLIFANGYDYQKYFHRAIMNLENVSRWLMRDVWFLKSKPTYVIRSHKNVGGNDCALGGVLFKVKNHMLWDCWDNLWLRNLALVK